MSQWKILIIDDNPEDRAVCRRQLQRDPNVAYLIEEADTGGAGLAVCQTFEPACILLDYRLPDLDGLEVLAQLQSNMTLRTRPAVVMLTGTGNEALAAEAIKNGAHDYLRKDELSAESLRLAVANSIEKAALRRMLDAQRRELEHLHAAVHQAGESTMITDADLETPGPRITFVNPAFTTMTGYTAEEVLGKTPRLLQGPKTDRAVLDRLARDLTEGRVFHGETVNYRKDGSEFVLEWRIAPLRDAEGRVTHFVATQHDITERKQAEVALREREQELDDFFDNATVGLHWVGPDGIILRVNQAELDLLGYTREEYVNHHIAEFHDDPAVIQDILQRLTNNEILQDYPARLRCKDGTVKHVLIDSSVMRKDERFLHTRCFTRDITARTEAEKGRERLLVELQRLNTELQQFTSIVSHDLNEPLRTISNFVTMPAQRYEGALDAEAQEYITFAVDGAQRMQQMIRDLLAYTRAGRTPEFEAVDCEALLARVVESVQLKIAECGAVITHDPLPIVHGDPTRLGLVLQNLIGNALKFCGQALPQIHVSAQRDDNHWRLSVRDNGIGIDPAQAERIFQVFQRLHTRSEYPGTGIGLAICKKIVEQHGGRIWMESRPGEGAIFYFTMSDSDG